MDQRDNLKGAALMAYAMAAFALNDTCVKLAARELPLMQVVLLRGLVASLAIGAALVLLRAPLRIDRRDLGLVLLRGLVEAGAAWTFLTALVHMPIADLTAILQALPLAVTLGAAVFFGEPVGWRRWAAIGAGFFGVLLIVRPGTEVFTISSLLGLLTVALAATRDLVTRRLSRGVPTLLVTFTSTAMVTAMGGVLSLGTGWIAPVPVHWALILCAAIFVTTAVGAIVAAMRVGEVGFVAPFRYAGLVAAMAAGFVVFGEFPDALTLAGAAIVVGSGAFAFWRERRLGLVRPRVPPR